MPFFNFEAKFMFSDKNQVGLMPNTSKLAKFGHFQEIYRVPENFWKLLGMIKF